MTIYQDKLREMVSEVDSSVEKLEGSISQIESQESELQEQIDAIRYGMMEPAEQQLNDYLLNVKIPELQPHYPALLQLYWDVPPIEQYKTLTTWYIYYIEIPDGTSVNIYEYEGTGWDSDVNIEKWVSDWDFGNDYLTRPLTDGATYGLKPYKSNLGFARGLLLENKEKIQDSKDIFGDYI